MPATINFVKGGQFNAETRGRIASGGIAPAINRLNIHGEHLKITVRMVMPNDQS